MPKTKPRQLKDAVAAQNGTKMPQIRSMVVDNILVKCPATIHSATFSSSQSLGYAMSPIRLCLVSCKAKRCKYNEFAAIGKEQRCGYVSAIAKNYPTKTQRNHWTTAAFYATIIYAKLRRSYAKIRRSYSTSLRNFDWPDRGRAKKTWLSKLAK